MKRLMFVLIGVLVQQALWESTPVTAQAVGEPDAALPEYLRDRGDGVSSSQFGTYIRRGELIIYPYYEYYHDNNIEYEPRDFGFGSTEEFRGKYRAHEGLLFFGLGVTDWLIVELEAAVIDATLTPSPDDTATTVGEISESGLGDVESQIRWRWFRETEGRPELFSYFETVFPLQKDKDLIGTKDWEFKLGFGVIKGLSFGTWTVRVSMAYDRAERKYEFGEYAVEYFRRLSDRFRATLMVEGEEDEVEGIVNLQIDLSRYVWLRLNTGIGLSSKATDWAPEVGVMFSIPAFR